MSIRYSGKTSTRAARNSTFHKKGSIRSYDPAPPVWERPGDWLDQPNFAPGEEKIVLLVAVVPNDSNWLAFTIAGAYTVDWGDGVVEDFASGARAQYNHDFDALLSPIRVDGTRFAHVTVTPQAANNLTAVDFNTLPVVAGATFRRQNGVVEIMYSCPSASQIPVMGSISSTNVSLTNMVSFIGVHMGTGAQSGYRLFGHCRSLRSIELREVPPYTSISQMFIGCLALIRAPEFDTSNATDASNMFNGCISLRRIPHYDTRSVTSMLSMFINCSALDRVPQLNTVSVTTMQTMFSGCWALRRIPLLDTSSVTTMQGMFSSCESLVDVPCMNTSSVTIMTSMFDSCFSLRAIPRFDTSNVTAMNTTFSGCSSLVDVPLLDTSKVTNMNKMFGSCRSLQSVPHFDTSACTNMGSMFNSCQSLYTIPHFDTSNVTDFTSMFNTCNSLAEVPFLDTSSATSASSMFNACRSLRAVHPFDFSRVTSASSLYAYCSKLEYLPVLNMPAATSFASMIRDCSALLDVRILNTGAASTTSKFNTIFTTAESLRSAVVDQAEYTLTVSNCSMGREGLESLMDSLGAIGAAGQTLTVSGNPGAVTPVSLSGTTGAGSTTITMANTTGIEVGMQVVGSGTGITTGRSVTLTEAGAVVGLAAHGLENDDEVSFSTIASSSGLLTNTIYHVINKTADDFQLSPAPSTMDVVSVYPDTLLKDLPLAYYRMGEPSGVVAADSTSSFNGTYINTPTLGVAGAIVGNDAVGFNGVNQYVQLPDLGIVGNIGRTIDFWVYPTTHTGARTIYAHSDSAANGTAFNVRMNGIAGGDIYLNLSNTDWYTPAGVCPLNAWTHVTITYPVGGNAGTVGIIKIYINGVAVTLTKVGAASVVLNTPTGPSRIGISLTGTQAFEGRLDEFAVFGHELPESNVWRGFKTGRGNFPVTFSGNGTGILRYRNIVTAVNPGVDVTLDRPAATSGTNTLVFRHLRTSTALLKGWAVTG